MKGRKSTSKFYHNLCYQSYTFRGVKSQQGVGKLFYFLKEKKKGISESMIKRCFVRFKGLRNSVCVKSEYGYLCLKLSSFALFESYPFFGVLTLA